MSDTESASAAPHPPVGGKSLPSPTTLKKMVRPRYKSWRKKYRKMRFRFDYAFELNKRLFKEEQKLESVAKRLREDLDGLLELCLEMNQDPAIPPEFRYNIAHDTPLLALAPQAVPENLTPEEANTMFTSYNAAVRSGQIPHVDLHVIRETIDARLAAQEVENLEDLEARVPHAILSSSSIMDDPTPVNYLTPDQENDYILRLDAKLGDAYSLKRTSSSAGAAVGAESDEKEKHWAELTPRELERQVELLNPQSQHNWLKAKARMNPSGAPLGFTEGPDDNESLASHDNVPPAGTKGSSRKRPSTKNLAKQVGDRALERAREEWSPGAGSAMDEDELAGDDSGVVSAAKKKGRDPDGTYRLKGSKGGNSKGKRKRSGEDVGEGAAGGGVALKKAKVEGEGE